MKLAQEYGKQSGNGMVTLNEIVELVEKDTNIMLRNKRRNREIVYARAVFFKLARKHTYEPLCNIGGYVNKDHSTVLHGIKIFNDVIEHYKDQFYVSYVKLDRLIKRKNKTRERDLEPEKYYRNKYGETLIKYRSLLNQCKKWGLMK